ncbi:hypothetical protein K432DRAFT_309201 [Lepidopterella palustris CBS 459.81]|uniref:Integral membrane protein TmpA n=1 Tax=Lepidopterella palustris CBS 459.81 TaxID=1314670 RepID=A0A8E2E0R9_9PEZI|nr:hypothetical protein K432DRAFT_309201 [Lepidopterella palustris CBS 459.81]
MRGDSATEVDIEEGFKQARDLEQGIPSTTHSCGTSEASCTSISTSTSTSTILSKSDGLPNKRQNRILRNLRHTFLNVYQRLFSLAFIGNMIAFTVILARHRTASHLPLSDLATAASANITVAILVRQDYMINFLFRLCWLVPHSATLRLRCMLAKVYEYGGVHSGAAFASVVWFLLLTITITIDYSQNVTPYSLPIFILTLILLTLFLTILIFTLPALRRKYHNIFEYTHRYLGWISIALFWAELLLLTFSIAHKTSKTPAYVLIRLPTFWFLVITTVHIILPWLFLRRVTVTPEILSQHAIRIRFPDTVPRVTGLAIAKHPLGQWHPFASFPDTTGNNSPTFSAAINPSNPTKPLSTSGCSLLVSRAGDWTTDAIANPRTSYYLRGLPRTGVLSMACIFSRVVIVTTGSGIGPCLSFLLSQSQATTPSSPASLTHNVRRTHHTRRTHSHIIWSTPSPLKTYGAEICALVMGADEGAMVIDTRESGRPDMVTLAWEMYRRVEAEAVFVISNPALTRKVVYGMQARGVPAFGPIWDS